MEGRTSIVIAHRLTTIERCDRLIVLENGKVAESGSFDELKNAGGVFTNISSHIPEDLPKNLGIQ